MAITGIADVAGTIQKVVSALTTKTLIQNSVALAMPGIWDRSSEVGPGMDRLDMFVLAELAIQTVSETGVAMTPQSINPTGAQLLLENHKAVPFSITDRGALQSKIQLLSKTVENAVRTLAAEVDDDIFAEAVANAKTSATVAGADALADILNAKAQFDADNVPKEGRAIAASPVFMKDLLGTNSVLKANEFGSADPIRMGRVTNIYGFDIFESSSSSLAADGFLALGMEAVAFARQRAVSLRSQEQVLQHATDYALSHLYGSESTAAANPRIYNFDPA